MKRKKKAMPQFKSVEEESDFWDTHSPLDFEWREVTMAEVIRASAKNPKKRVVTLELDEPVVERLKSVAKERGLSHHSLANQLLSKELTQP